MFPPELLAEFQPRASQQSVRSYEAARASEDAASGRNLRSSLRHENIVEYLGAEIEEADRKLHIFQEWVPGGSLSAVAAHLRRALDDDVNRRYLEHCLRGLVYLHEHRVVHRDVKGENVLISDTGVAKLADMGASKRIHAEGTLLDTESSLKGTPYFMAPEQMRQRVGRRGLGLKI
ncbi:MAP kinase kinase kinase [Aureococcus anophagefferens]|nr:MAP kinase kinase kinase [Aureococcus anophagefferens]